MHERAHRLTTAILMTIILQPASSTHKPAAAPLSLCCSAFSQALRGVPPAVGAQHANKEDSSAPEVAVLTQKPGSHMPAPWCHEVLHGVCTECCAIRTTWRL